MACGGSFLGALCSVSGWARNSQGRILTAMEPGLCMMLGSELSFLPCACSYKRPAVDFKECRLLSGQQMQKEACFDVNM